jgi:anti-sigma factor ChrR (cupin superfamily)
VTTAFARNINTHQDLGPLESRIADPKSMPWQSIRYPGVSVKTLMMDKASGLVTVLLKMESGARLPDHEHALIEQTYVLEGSLVDTEGPEVGMEVGPGQFVWRPAGSRHAVVSPNGCTIIAIFQAPNKFYEGGAKALDMMGDDWGVKWGHVMPPAKQASPAKRGPNTSAG